jgi:hypothetical protein
MGVRCVCRECNTTYQLKSEAAGRRIRCKVCGAVFRVPQPRSTEGSPVRRPRSKSQPAAVAQSKPKSKPRRERDAIQSRDTLPPRLPPRVKSRSRREPEPVRANVPRKRKASRHKYHSWTAGVDFANPLVQFVCGVLCIFMLLASTVVVAVRSNDIAGSIFIQWIGLGLSMMLVGIVWGLITAFREGFVSGILYLLIPCYRLYYAITRWDKMWAPFLINISGHAMVYSGDPIGEFVQNVWLSR